MKTRGRPPELDPMDVIAVDGLHAKSLLQEASERKAIVTLLVDMGGRARVHELVDHYGYDIRPKLRALIANGWIARKDFRRWDGKMPRRRKA